MPSEIIRDPVEDQLLTPQNSVLIIIDYAFGNWIVREGRRGR